MNRPFAAAVAGLAVMTASAMLLPAHAAEDDVDDAARAGQTVAEYGANLVTGMVPLDWVPSDPVGYAGQAAQAGQAVAAFGAGLVTDMVPLDWVPSDPVDEAGRVADAGQSVAGFYTGLVTGFVPPVPAWAADPVGYAKLAAEVGKAYVEYGAANHYGGGPFTGDFSWGGRSGPFMEECLHEGAPVRGVVSMTADVAFSTDAGTFTGPLGIRGTACGAQEGWTAARWVASGTDSFGNTLHCPRLGGVARWTTFWSANVVGACTFNGVALPRVQLFMNGEHASTGKASGAVAGALFVNTY